MEIKGTFFHLSFDFKRVRVFFLVASDDERGRADVCGFIFCM